MTPASTRPDSIPPEYERHFLARHWYALGFKTGRLGVQPSASVVRALLNAYTMTVAQAYEAGAIAGLRVCYPNGHEPPSERTQ